MILTGLERADALEQLVSDSCRKLYPTASLADIENIVVRFLKMLPIEDREVESSAHLLLRVFIICALLYIFFDV